MHALKCCGCSNHRNNQLLLHSTQEFSCSTRKLKHFSSTLQVVRSNFNLQQDSSAIYSVFYWRKLWRISAKLDTAIPFLTWIWWRPFIPVANWRVTSARVVWFVIRKNALIIDLSGECRRVCPFDDPSCYVKHKLEEMNWKDGSDFLYACSQMKKWCSLYKNLILMAITLENNQQFTWKISVWLSQHFTTIFLIRSSTTLKTLLLTS